MPIFQVNYLSPTWVRFWDIEYLDLAEVSLIFK